MRKTLAIAIAAALIGGCSSGGHSGAVQMTTSGKIVETVNGQAVPESLLEAIARQHNLHLDKPGARDQALNLLTDMIIVAQAAQREPFASDENYQADIEAARLKGVADATLRPIRKRHDAQRRHAQGRIRHRIEEGGRSHLRFWPASFRRRRRSDECRRRTRFRQAVQRSVRRVSDQGQAGEDVHARARRPDSRFARQIAGVTEKRRKHEGAGENRIRLSRRASGYRQSVHAAAIRAGEGRHPPRDAGQDRPGTSEETARDGQDRISSRQRTARGGCRRRKARAATPAPADSSRPRDVRRRWSCIYRRAPGIPPSAA